MLTLAFFFTPPVKGDTFGCPALLQSESELAQALPERIRRLVTDDNAIRWTPNRQEAWQAFHEALDDGFKHKGFSFDARIGDLKAKMRFEESASGKIELWIELLKRDGLDIGEQSINGRRFLDLIAAQISWFEHARKTHGIQDFEIIGANLQNKKLASTLKSLGFRVASPRVTNCFIAGSLVGASVFVPVFGFQKILGLSDDITLATTSGVFSITTVLCIMQQDSNLGLRIQLPPETKTSP